MATLARPSRTSPVAASISTGTWMPRWRMSSLRDSYRSPVNSGRTSSVMSALRWGRSHRGTGRASGRGGSGDGRRIDRGPGGLHPPEDLVDLPPGHPDHLGVDLGAHETPA